MTVCVSASGYMLIGNDVKLNSPMSLVAQALAEILQHPDRARDALRVLLHLVRHHTPVHTPGPIPSQSWQRQTSFSS